MFVSREESDKKADFELWTLMHFQKKLKLKFSSTNSQTRPPSFLTGPGLLPPPSERPPVRDLLGGHPALPGARAPVRLLHQRVCLLREGHRPLLGPPAERGGPPGADEERPGAPRGPRYV